MTRVGSAPVRWGLAIAAMLGILVALAPPVAAANVKQTVGVIRIDGAPNDGTARLVRTNSGITMSITTPVAGQLFELPAGIPLDPDWEVGDATTNWFVVFNEPGSCVGGCGEDEVIAAFEGDNFAGVGIHHATGHVAGSSIWKAAGSLHEGDTKGAVFGLPLMDAMAAEIHIVVRSHGPMKTIPPGERGYALNSVDGGCSTNTCGDAQAAIFPPPA